MASRLVWRVQLRYHLKPEHGAFGRRFRVEEWNRHGGVSYIRCFGHPGLGGERPLGWASTTSRPGVHLNRPWNRAETPGGSADTPTSDATNACAPYFVTRRARHGTKRPPASPALDMRMRDESGRSQTDPRSEWWARSGSGTSASNGSPSTSWPPESMPWARHLRERLPWWYHQAPTHAAGFTGG